MPMNITKWVEEKGVKFLSLSSIRSNPQMALSLWYDVVRWLEVIQTTIYCLEIFENVVLSSQL